MRDFPTLTEAIFSVRTSIGKLVVEIGSNYVWNRVRLLIVSVQRAGGVDRGCDNAQL